MEIAQRYINPVVALMLIVLWVSGRGWGQLLALACIWVLVSTLLLVLGRWQVLLEQVRLFEVTPVQWLVGETEPDG